MLHAGAEVVLQQRVRGRIGQGLSGRQRLSDGRAVARRLRERRQPRDYQLGSTSLSEQRRHRRQGPRRRLHGAERRAERHASYAATATAAAATAATRRLDAYYAALPGDCRARWSSRTTTPAATDIAYRDTTSGNAGGAYRSNAVDIKASDRHRRRLSGRLDDAPASGSTTRSTSPTAATYALDVRLASERRRRHVPHRGQRRQQDRRDRGPGHGRLADLDDGDEDRRRARAPARRSIRRRHGQRSARAARWPTSTGGQSGRGQITDSTQRSQRTETTSSCLCVACRR